MQSPVALPQDSVRRSSRRHGRSDYLPMVVDAGCATLKAAWRKPQIVHSPSLPEEWARCGIRTRVERGVAASDDLPPIVDSQRLAVLKARKNAQVDHTIRSRPQAGMRQTG